LTFTQTVKDKIISDYAGLSGWQFCQNRRTNSSKTSK